MKNLRTIVLAAGKGTRMKSSVPKVLHEVCGRPILQYVLDVVKAVGSLKTYVVVGHQAQSVKEILPKDAQCFLQKQLNGTADAVKTVASSLKSYNGDVLILCGDTPLLKKEVIKELVKKHKKTKAECTFLSAVVLDPFGYGRVIRDFEGRTIAIREDKDASELERNIAEINVGA